MKKEKNKNKNKGVTLISAHYPSQYSSLQVSSTFDFHPLPFFLSSSLHLHSSLHGHIIGPPNYTVHLLPTLISS